MSTPNVDQHAEQANDEQQEEHEREEDELIQSLSAKFIDGSSIVLSNVRTVNDVKEKLQSAMGLPPSEQRLIYRGRVLIAPTRSLASYSIKSGETIHVIKRSSNSTSNDVPPVPSAAASNGTHMPGQPVVLFDEVVFSGNVNGENPLFDISEVMRTAQGFHMHHQPHQQPAQQQSSDPLQQPQHQTQQQNSQPQPLPQSVANAMDRIFQYLPFPFQSSQQQQHQQQQQQQPGQPQQQGQPHVQLPNEQHNRAVHSVQQMFQFIPLDLTQQQAPQHQEQQPQQQYSQQPQSQSQQQQQPQPQSRQQEHPPQQQSQQQQPHPQSSRQPQTQQQEQQPQQPQSQQQQHPPQQQPQSQQQQQPHPQQQEQQPQQQPQQPQSQQQQRQPQQRFVFVHPHHRRQGSNAVASNVIPGSDVRGRLYNRMAFIFSTTRSVHMLLSRYEEANNLPLTTPSWIYDNSNDSFVELSNVTEHNEESSNSPNSINVRPIAHLIADLIDRYSELSTRISFYSNSVSLCLRRSHNGTDVLNDYTLMTSTVEVVGKCLSDQQRIGAMLGEISTQLRFLPGEESVAYHEPNRVQRAPMVRIQTVPATGPATGPAADATAQAARAARAVRASIQLVPPSNVTTRNPSVVHQSASFQINGGTVSEITQQAVNSMLGNSSNPPSSDPFTQLVTDIQHFFSSSGESTNTDTHTFGDVILPRLTALLLDETDPFNVFLKKIIFPINVFDLSNRELSSTSALCLRPLLSRFILDNLLEAGADLTRGSLCEAARIFFTSVFSESRCTSIFTPELLFFVCPLIISAAEESTATTITNKERISALITAVRLRVLPHICGLFGLAIIAERSEMEPSEYANRLNCIIGNIFRATAAALISCFHRGTVDVKLVVKSMFDQVVKAISLPAPVSVPLRHNLQRILHEFITPFLDSSLYQIPSSELHSLYDEYFVSIPN